MLVSLILKAVDLATAPIRSVTSSLVSMVGTTGDANDAAGVLRNTFVQGALQANIYGAAIAQVQKGIGFFNSKMEEAKSLQLSNTQAATTFASMTGMSYDEGAAFIEKMNQRLAQSAAALPGATQDYKTLATAIQDNVLDAFKSASGIDMSGFENSLAAISESYGALSAASGTPVQNTMLGLTKALGGASTASLRQIQFFEQNQVILNEIDKRLKTLGKSTLADLDIKQRVKLIEEVGKKYITEDFKKQAGQSVDGLIQSFNSSLFDPSSGIFGLMRDLDPDTKGVQSAFSTFNDVLVSLIGTDGLVTRINTMFQTLGLTIDPMALAQSALLRFNDMVKGLSAIFESANVQFTAGNFQEGFNILFSKVGEVIFYQVKAIATTVATTVTSFLTGDIPQKIASGLAGSLQAQTQALPERFMKMSGAEQAATAAIGAMTVFSLLNIKLGTVERMIGGQAATVTMSVGRLLGEISIGAATGAGNAILGVGGAMRSLVTGGTAFITVLRGMSLASLWSGLVGGLGAATGAITTFAGSLVTAGAALLLNPITLGIVAIATAGLLIYKYWQPITGFISGFVSGLIQGLAPLKPAFEGAGNALKPLIDLVKDGVSWFMRLIQPVEDTDGKARSLGETFGRILAGGIVSSVNALKSFVEWVGKTLNWAGQLPDAIGNAIKGFAGWIEQGINWLGGLIDKAKQLPGAIGSALNGFMSNLGAGAGAAFSAFTNDPVVRIIGAGLQVLGTLVTTVGQIVDAFGNALGTATATKIGEMGQAVVTFVAPIGQFFVELEQAIAQGVSSTGQTITFAFTSFFNDASEAVNSIGSTIAIKIGGAGQAIAQGASNVGQVIAATFTGFFDGVASIISGTMNSVIVLVKSKIDGFISLVNNAINSLALPSLPTLPSLSGTANAATSSASNISGTISSFGSQAIGAINSFFGVAPRYQGHIPSAASGTFGMETGLIRAALIESRAKPPGSDLVVANTSEMILNSSQQRSLAGAITPTIATGGRSLNIQIGDIVTPEGITDPSAIASYVIDRIRQEIAAELYQQLG